MMLRPIKRRQDVVLRFLLLETKSLQKVTTPIRRSQDVLVGFLSGYALKISWKLR